MEVKLKEEQPTPPPPPLSESDQERVKQWFADKGGGDNPCSVCGNKEWSVGPHWVFAPLLSARGIALNQGYPFVMLFCTRCANTHFFHAGVLMLLPTPGVEPQPPKSAEPEGHDGD